MFDAGAVAKWMAAEVNAEKVLYQDAAAYSIAEKFGKDFVYINDSGNVAIQKQVLSEFRKLTEHAVVWIRGERCWRLREEFDEPGRGQK